MKWSIWIKASGAAPASAEQLHAGSLVYFRRANTPDLGCVVPGGDEIRVPVMRCDADGWVKTPRVYRRSRSQLYVAAPRW